MVVGVHWLIAELSYRSDRFGILVKGRAQVIVRDGKADRKVMSSTKISEKDLLEEARLNGQVAEVERIELATLERNGEVSVIPKD